MHKANVSRSSHQVQRYYRLAYIAYNKGRRKQGTAKGETRVVKAYIEPSEVFQSRHHSSKDA